MKDIYLIILAIILIVVSCTRSIDVDYVTQYKCGDMIVYAQYLDDDSVILTINGNNVVLNRTVANNKNRFDSNNSDITFIEEEGDIYLKIKGNEYPMCIELEY